MKILVMDEAKKRGMQIADILHKSNHDVACCLGSNELLTRLQHSLPDRLLLDFETWRNGRAIYAYFDVGARLAHVPIVFYNVPEDFTSLPGRPKHGRDKLVPKPAKPESVAEIAVMPE